MEVTITKLNHEGKGITKIDNKITFIPNILTKEVADIEITKEYKKFNLGKVTKYISTSDSRVVPACAGIGKVQIIIFYLKILSSILFQYLVFSFLYHKLRHKPYQ